MVPSATDGTLWCAGAWHWIWYQKPIWYQIGSSGTCSHVLFSSPSKEHPKCGLHEAEGLCQFHLFPNTWSYSWHIESMKSVHVTVSILQGSKFWVCKKFVRASAVDHGATLTPSSAPPICWAAALCRAVSWLLVHTTLFSPHNESMKWLQLSLVVQ